MKKKFLCPRGMNRETEIFRQLIFNRSAFAVVTPENGIVLPGVGEVVPFLPGFHMAVAKENIDGGSMARDGSRVEAGICVAGIDSVDVITGSEIGFWFCQPIDF